MPPYFADVSAYQGSNDLATYANTGHLAFACKATEGVTYKDSRFAENWRKAADAKVVIRIAYHFAHPSHNAPETEAREFLRTWYAAGARSTDLLCLDIEASPKPYRSQNQEWISRFAKFVIKHAGRGPLVYSGGWWWNPNVGAWWDSSLLLGYWHSAYNDVMSNLPANHGRVWFWQFTDGQVGPTPHSLPGIGTCDVNRILLGWDDLRARARGSAFYVARFLALRTTWRVHLARP